MCRGRLGPAAHAASAPAAIPFPPLEPENGLGRTATLHVCITCRREGELAEGEARPGAILHERLTSAGAPDGVNIVPVECLSACSNGCSVALSRPGSWSYVYGRLDPEQHVPEILAGAAAYAVSADGIVPWRERPLVFRKQSIARIPPLPIAGETA